MGQFKERMNKLRSKIRAAQRTQDERITFLVPDRESLTIASKTLAKVRIPDIPQLRTLEKAYTFGDTVIRALNPKSIKIIEKPGSSKEELYQANARSIHKLVEERNAIAAIIQNVIQPVIKVVAGNSIEIEELKHKLMEHERRILEYEKLNKTVYGRSPVVADLPGGKKPFGGKMYEAADEVLRLYAEDCKLPPIERKWKSERNASDAWFDSHLLVNNPDATKDKVYWSVEKRKSLLS